MAFKIEKYISDFPALSKKMNGQRLAFLDSGASAQKPSCVINAMTEVMEGGYANIHRGLYPISQEITARFEDARQTVSKFINANSSNEVIFTKGATEAINLIAQSWGADNLREGDEIILSAMEHHANIVPWQLLRDKTGIKIKVIPMTDDGELDLEAFEKLLTHKTKLVSITHTSNAIGTINPVKKITAIAKDFYPDMVVVIDGAQGIVHGKTDVTDIGADFYVFSGHKLYAPTGIGVLWGREKILNSMPPYQGGGDMIDEVSFERSTYKDAPQRFEAGTPSIIEAIGLEAAIKYVDAIGMENIAAHEQEILSYGTALLGEIPDLTIYGNAKNKAGILSFTIKDMHHSDVATILGQCGVALRAGHHCCMPLMKRLNIQGTLRASFALYSTKSDVEQLVDGLNKARKMLS